MFDVRRSMFDVRRSLLVMGLFITALLMMGCHSPYDRGVAALERGDYGSAERSAREGLADEPSSAELRLLLAEANEGLGRHRQAVNDALAAIVSRQLDEAQTGRAHRVASTALAALGEPVEASLHAIEAQALGEIPNDIALRQSLRLAVTEALRVNRPGDALVLLRHLIRLEGAVGNGAAVVELEPLITATGQSAVQQLIDLGSFSGALSLLEELSGEFPETIELIFLRGVVERRLGRQAVSEATFRRFVAADGPTSTADRLARVADALAEIRDWSGAAAYLEEAIQEDPDRLESYLSLARAHFASARVEQAQGALDDYLERAASRGDETLAGAFLTAYELALEMGQPDVGLATLELGHARVHDFEVTAALALANLRRQRSARAEELLRDFIDRSSSPAESAERVGDWYYERGEAARAATFYREATAAEGASNAVYLKLAQAYAATDWSFEMVGALDAYIQNAEDSSRARRTAARLLATHQLWSDAARVLLPLVEDDPNDEALILELGDAYFYSGQQNQEIELYETWLSTTSAPGTTSLRIAQRFLDRGSYRDALVWLDRATEYDESHRQALLQLGRTYQMLERFDEMWTSYYAYIDASDGAGSAYEEVLESFEGRRFASQAVTILELMIERWPEDEALRLALGERLIESGNTSAAQEALFNYVLSARDPVDAARRSLWSLRRAGLNRLGEDLMARLARERPDLEELALVNARLYSDMAGEYQLAFDLESMRANQAVARRYYRQFLDGQPSQAAVLVRAASEMDAAGFYDLAVEAYSLAIERGAEVEQFRRSYGLVLLRTGENTQLARQLLREELRHASDPNELAVEAAGLLATFGQSTAALELLRVAQERARNDAERRLLFATGADLLLNAGDVRGLRDFADDYVEASNDQLSALLDSADVMVQAGDWEATRSRLELALTLAPQQSDVLTALARLDYLTGDLEAGFARLEASPQPVAAWRAYAQFFEAHNELPAARRALIAARDTGGADAYLMMSLGTVEVRLGETEAAVAAFDAALDTTARTRRSVDLRRQIYTGIIDSLSQQGRFDLVDVYLERALIDQDLSPFFLLAAAQLALERGQLDRGRQMLRAYLDRDGGLQDVIELELRFDFLAGPVDRIGRAVLEDDPDSAARLLELFVQPVAEARGTGVLAAWIDLLGSRGADTTALRRELAGRLLRRGDVGQAILTLRELAADDPRYDLLVAALEAGRGEEQSALAGFERAFAVDDLARPLAPEQIRQLMSIMTVLGAAEGLDDLTTLLVREPVADELTLARFDWLLDRRRGIDALALFDWSIAERPHSGGHSTQDLADSDPVAEAIGLLALHGYRGEASSLADASLQDTPDERLRHAIRLAYERGDVERAESLLERYVELAAGHWPSLLAAGRMLSEIGRVDTVAELLAPMVEGGTDAEAREAIRVVARAAAITSRTESASTLLDTFIERPGNRYTNLLLLAEVYERAYAWSEAAATYDRALRLLPGREGAFAGIFRNTYRLGDLATARDRLERYPRPVASPEAILAALDRGAVVPFDGALQLEARTVALSFDPGSYARRADALLAHLALDSEGDAGTDILALFDELDGVAPGEALNRQIVLVSLRGLEHPLSRQYAEELAAGPETDVTSLLLSAEILTVNGFVDEASAALLSAVERAPQADALGVSTALLAFDLGLDQAVLELAQTELIGWRLGEALLETLSAASRLRSTSDLVDEGEIERLTTEAADWPEGLERLAQVLIERGDLSAAENILVPLARRPSLDAEGYVSLEALPRYLDLYFENHLASEAIDLLERHFPEVFNHPAVLADVRPLARILFAVEGLESAERILDQVLTHNPTNVELLSEKALLLAESGVRLDEAEQLSRRALSSTVEPLPDPLATLARIHFQQGRHELAADELRQAMRLLNPESPDYDIQLWRIEDWLSDIEL